MRWDTTEEGERERKSERPNYVLILLNNVFVM